MIIQPNPIRILLVDDDPLILFTLEKVIHMHRDLQVVGSMRNGHDALAFLQETKPDVVLLDIEMPFMNGIEFLQHIQSLHPAIIVILLTTFEKEHYVIEGLTRGARSYHLKTATFEYLDQNIRDALKGSFIMPARIAIKLSAFLQTKKDYREQSLSPLFFQTYGLTRAEQQVVSLLGKRFSNAEIAEQLQVQVGTVKNSLVIIFEKLHIRNRQEAIVLIESQLG